MVKSRTIVLPFSLREMEPSKTSVRSDPPGEEPARRVDDMMACRRNPVVLAFSVGEIRSKKRSCDGTKEQLPLKKRRNIGSPANQPNFFPHDMGKLSPQMMKPLQVIPDKLASLSMQKLPRKKQVRFAPLRATCTVPRVEDYEKTSVWWSDDELATNRRLDKELVHYYNVNDDSYRKYLKLASGMALGKLAPMERVVMALANSPLRGMERKVMVNFQTRLKLVVSLVVQNQKAWRAMGCKAGNDPDQALAARCSKLALPAVNFAQLIATGDAQYVVDMKLADTLL